MSGLVSELEKIYYRLRNVFLRGTLQRVREEYRLQRIQVRIGKDDPSDFVDHYQEFGHASSAPDDSEVLLLCRGGDRNNMVSICITSSKYRPKLKRGESAVYNAFNDVILLSENGIIIKSDRPIKVQGSLNVEGDITANNVTATGDVKSGAIALKNHVHPVDVSKGVTTGVQPGMDGGT